MYVCICVGACVCGARSDAEYGKDDDDDSGVVAAHRFECISVLDTTHTHTNTRRSIVYIVSYVVVVVVVVHLLPVLRFFLCFIFYAAAGCC